MTIEPWILAATADDVRRAVRVHDDADRRLAGGGLPPLAADIWVYDDTLTHVLLVEHPWRGWVPPGGRVEPGETPREAAARELREETGVVATPLELPAAATVRSYREDWAATLGLSYVAVTALSTPLCAEDGQPAAWHRLDGTWTGWFPEDRDRMRAHAAYLAQQGTGLRSDSTPGS